MKNQTEIFEPLPRPPLKGEGSFPDVSPFPFREGGGGLGLKAIWYQL